MSDIVKIASVCHEANRMWCACNGDHSQPEWMDAPQWQVESAINGVEHALAHPDATAEDMHKSWMNAKFDDGWIYGEVKDPVAKTHPCMLLSYDQLPEFQRKKDALFLAIVRALK